MHFRAKENLSFGGEKAPEARFFTELYEANTEEVFAAVQDAESSWFEDLKVLVRD